MSTAISMTKGKTVAAAPIVAAAAAAMIPLEFSQEFTHGSVKTAMQGVSSGDLWKVPVDQLHVMPGLNVRGKSEEYTAHVERLARSIFEEGFYPDKALAVFIAEDGRIIVRDGHSRLEAVKRAIEMGAQITTLPCVTAPRGTSMVDITIGLVKSNTGRPLLPIEVAAVCKRLVNWGWEVPAIAERLDYTPAYIDELLNLLSAPEALVKLVSAGKVSATTAMEEIKKQGPAKASAAIVEAAKAAPKGKVTAKSLKASKASQGNPETAPKGKAKAAKPSPNGPAITALNAVFDDKNFNKLSDAVQQMVLELVDA